MDRPRHSSARRRATALLVAAGLILGLGLAAAACGDEEQASGPSPAATEDTSPSPTEPSPSPTETMTESPSPTAEPKTPKPDWAFLRNETYREWVRAPGWDQRKTTDSPHSSGKEVFIDAATAAALGSGADRYPAGATIVKEGYDDAGNLAIIAAMQRLKGEGWYFSEYRPDGSVIAEGDNVAICTQCHQGGDDGVLAFPLD